MKIVMALLWLMHWLPLPVMGRLGKLVGTVLYYSMRDRRHITRTNLRLCFPEMTEKEIETMAIRHFQAYSRSVFERSILWWASEARIKKLIVVEPTFPHESIAEGPVILLCPHFVCLDIAGAAVAMEVSASSMYVRQKNSAFDTALLKGRSRFKPPRLFTRQDGIKTILRSLRDGMPYFMLPDMDFGIKDAEFVPFFRQASRDLDCIAPDCGSGACACNPRHRDIFAELSGLESNVLPAVGRLPWRRHEGSYTPDECIY